MSEFADGKLTECLKRLETLEYAHRRLLWILRAFGLLFIVLTPPVWIGLVAHIRPGTDGTLRGQALVISDESGQATISLRVDEKTHEAIIEIMSGSGGANLFLSARPEGSTMTLFGKDGKGMLLFNVVPGSTGILARSDGRSAALNANTSDASIVLREDKSQAFGTLLLHEKVGPFLSLTDAQGVPVVEFPDKNGKNKAGKNKREE